MDNNDAARFDAVCYVADGKPELYDTVSAFSFAVAEEQERVRVEEATEAEDLEVGLVGEEVAEDLEVGLVGEEEAEDMEVDLEGELEEAEAQEAEGAWEAGEDQWAGQTRDCSRGEAEEASR
ncbi:hypothetical protein CYMTET_55028 [Cymbomonas tetramitiformis]|uniref:Uncharacterized protein n=1 Tax=Cymbomonas tetramitiformis TaxID=36881 RepID=A0AAE0BF31_9CHLO|nr:hypothetical protein CYMTET_55028 [Cymbomonas tetramitiformis]